MPGPFFPVIALAAAACGARILKALVCAGHKLLMFKSNAINIKKCSVL